MALGIFLRNSLGLVGVDAQLRSGGAEVTNLCGLPGEGLDQAGDQQS